MIFRHIKSLSQWNVGGTGAGLSLVSTPQLIQKKKTSFQGLCRVNETHKLHHHDKVPAQGEGLKIFKIIILIGNQTESSHSLRINRLIYYIMLTF